MLKQLAPLLTAVALAGSMPLAAQTTAAPNVVQRASHLRHGINASLWFAQSPNNYGAARLRAFTTEDDLALMSKLGFDHVRIGIDAVPLTSWQHGEPDGVAFMAELDRVVDRALADKLAVIVDIHPESSYKQKLLAGDEGVAAFKDLWKAVAAHYANRDADHVFFELLNEPEQTDPARWNTIQTGLVDSIRSVDKTHTLIATGIHWSGLDELLTFEPLADPDIIYTFHFYEPFAFTHQGATWAMNELKPLRGVPYPAKPGDVEANLAQEPTLPAKFFIEKYALDHWDAKRIDATLSFAAQWSRLHNVPVYCGEFGVDRDFAPEKARQHWVHDTRTALEHNGIGWAMWDYQTGNFGLVTKKNGTTDVDKGLVHALGLKN